MIEVLKAVLFGIVEGITEWLPVSSTGHLILLNEFINLNVSEEFQSMFDVVIQLGAILAVCALFFRKLNPFDRGKNDEQKKQTWTLWFKVIAAIIPSGVYGVAFIAVEKWNEHRELRYHDVNNLPWGTAMIIGVSQCLSLVPGTSRSGSTILGGILAGVSRGTAAEFSFFMAIPTMVGASGIKLLKFFLSGVSFSAMDMLILLVGCTVSYIVSLLVIKGLMNYVRKHSFSAFGVYRIVLGIAVLLYFLVIKK